MSHRRDFDVVVVGAGFAGSTFARVAAQQGACGLLLENSSDVGQVVHSTGVLIAEVLELTHIPQSILLDPVHTFHIYPPDRRRIALNGPGFRYWMSNPAGLLRGLAEAATAAGSELQTDARFTQAQSNSGGVIVTCCGSFSCEACCIRCRLERQCLVCCDSACRAWAG